MGLEEIFPTIFLIAVLILVLPAFLSSNSKLKMFLKNLSIWTIIILAITIVCFWSLSLLLGAESYFMINNFFQSFFGKFIAVGLCWTFSFHILNELRHLFWDLGYGFDQKTSKITGVLALIGSFVLTILFYLIGKNIF